MNSYPTLYRYLYSVQGVVKKLFKHTGLKKNLVRDLGSPPPPSRSNPTPQTSQIVIFGEDFASEVLFWVYTHPPCPQHTPKVLRTVHEVID